MKRTMLLAMVLVTGLFAQTLHAASLPALEIYGSVGFGALLSGDQKDIPDTYLSPTPDSYGLLMGMLGARVYVIEQIGIEGFVAIGNVKAEAKGVDAMTLYDYTLYNAGLILRGNIPLGTNGTLSLYAGGGLSFGGPRIDKEFDDWAISNLGGKFLSITNTMGWYGKAGLAYHIDRTWFVDLTAFYFSTKAKFSSGFGLDGNLLDVAIGIGVALF